jgi:predicted peroxiredoxin
MPFRQDSSAMAPGKPQKMVIVATHGMDHPELATIPLVVGNAALAMDTKVVLILQSAGVAIATKGIYEHIFAVGFDPAQKLLDSFVEFGGKILVCIPCLGPRQITPESLVPGAEPVKAARVVTELLEADAVVCY